MSLIRKSFFKGYSSVLAIILAIFGCSVSCTRKDMYGTPDAKFIINGNVKSTNTDQAIPGIMAVTNQDSAQSDNAGNFSLANHEYPQTQTFYLRLRDIDGSANGEFLPLDTTVTFTNPTFTGGDGDWYEGETLKSIDIKMKPAN